MKKAVPAAAHEHDELGFASIAEIGRLLRKRKVSSVEVAGWHLDRLATVGRRYNAVAEITRATALREAERADRRLRQGNAPALCGIPYGAKDLLDTKGIPTRWGSPAYADRVPDRDATVVERLRAAGAVLAAKLSLVELAGGARYGSASASLHGPGKNPWDANRWSGGSSSGSAIAVGVGAVPFSIGSETGASLVLPSAYCGVTGLRPTFGAVSKHGAMALAWSNDRIGPIAHTALDCAVVLAAIAGRDEHDPTTVEWDFRGPARARTLRVGVLPADFSANPRNGAAFERALAVLRRLGHRVRRVELPAFDYATTHRAISNGEIAAEHEEFLRGPGIEKVVNDVQREALRALLTQPPFAYARAMRERAAITRAVRDMFKGVDVLVGPTALPEAPTLDTDLTTLYGPRRGGYTYLGALAGLPELTVPMGFGPNAMPYGLSFIGDLLSEATLLRAGASFQAATDWHTRRPPIPAPAA